MTKAIAIQPNHVAVLVRSVDRAAEFLEQYGFDIGPAENWEGEGTKEIYVAREKGNSLLLMEPVKPGAYQRAMDKRGPGLHHLAIDVQNLGAFLDSLSSTGWLLHPMSIRTMRKTKTAYLARPGFPALIEVQEQAERKIRSNFVDKIGLRFSQDLSGLAAAIGLEYMICREENESWLSCAGKPIPLATLCLGETI